jgi:hypothetical protein
MRQIQFNSARVFWDGQGLPFIVFNDGAATYALPRQPLETEALGYTDTALGNFEHECLHVFLNEKLDDEDNRGFSRIDRWRDYWVKNSVLRRAADGVEFVGQVLDDAIFEESLVLGLQVAMNNLNQCDEKGNTALPGFCFHMARGCYMNAKAELARLGLDIDALAAEARVLIKGTEPQVCSLGNNCLEVPQFEIQEGDSVQ